METVYFYHPARNDRVGGAQLVVCNIAEFFISKDINIGLIDYPDGFCKKELDRRGCDIYHFIDLSEIEKIEISGRILAFNQFLNHSPIYFSGSSKVIIWDVYYPFWGMLYSGLIRKFKRNLITLIASKKALIVMDAMGKNEIERIIDYSSNIKVVPVPNEKLPLCVNTELNDDDLSISYLGRAEIWKVTPFCKLYMDVRKVTDTKFSVYTDDVEEFKSLVRKVNGEIVLENVLFFENFSRENIYENIAKKSTFAAAMGTAALEIANSGVPTILLDLSYNEFPDEYKYKWLYQNKMKGSLGRDITNNNSNNDGYSVDEILEQLDNIREDISKDCMEYVKINHSIEYVAKEILSSFEESELSIDELNKFIETNKFLLYYLKAKFFLRTTILKKSALAYIE